MNEDYIREQSKIYGRNSTRKLSRYEEQMNEASANLCLQSPNLLSDRTLLLKECRRVVDEEGYDYKKGKSRSRSLNTSVASEPPKRKNITEKYRLSRIAELQERIKDITDRLGYKEKRRESASIVRNYKECDQITEQMSELKCERKRLDIELASLNKKQKKSKWYFNKKSRGPNRSLVRRLDQIAVNSPGWTFFVLRHHVAAVIQSLHLHYPIPALEILLHMAHCLRHRKLKILLTQLSCHLNKRTRICLLKQVSQNLNILKSICHFLPRMKVKPPNLFSPASPVDVSGEAITRTCKVLCRAKYYSTRYLSSL